MKQVNRSIRKKDAMQLLTGKPVYTDDLAPQECLIVKVLRSPHANAMIRSIRTDIAKKVPGIVAIYTWEDIPEGTRRYTNAGQTYPEMSPYDRLVLDRHVRYVGDAVAIVAGETEKAVDRAMKMIRVEYEVLESLLDFRISKDNAILVHPEDNWESLVPCGADNRRNLCYYESHSEGDVEGVLADCDVVIDHTYHTKACQQAMMEPFTTFCTLDPYGRLNVVSSTQVIFHVRRILSHALGIPQAKIRVTKPRVGGGFGAKQTILSEVYSAFVTWHTKRPSKMAYTRRECQIASTPRHEMDVHVRVGAMKDGTIRCIDLHAISNAGAYGEHSPTTIGLTGHKPLGMYGQMDAFRFVAESVYTNVMAAGAYRGYGATQGFFAVESAVNELAHKLNIDPFDIRQKNVTREGEIMPAYFGEMNTSCALDRCLDKVREMIHWDEKYPVRDLGNGKVRAVGMSCAMQGSGISALDVGGATLRLTEGGVYSLLIAAADMGTGCDTTLSQIAAEVLECEPDDITVFGADTDISPYDSGSYASSTAYVTGKAVEKAALALKDKMLSFAADKMHCSVDQVEFVEGGVRRVDTGDFLSRADIGNAATAFNRVALEVTVAHTSPTSPPPFIAGAAEVEIDLLTGEAKVVEFDAAVDCGTALNPALARVQTEGGLLQGIGMALTEDIHYTEKGRVIENSLMQYKIPTRLDIGHINVELVSSYEPNGPFGAKSIGEVVINPPGPAIADAIYNATGHRFLELPITPEQIAMNNEYVD